VPSRQVLAYLGQATLVVLGVSLVAGATTYDRFQPVAITLGPSTTVYFREPTLETRLHEAIHRRQMRDKSPIGRLVNALRYNFDYRYRLDEEAEAKAGELCLQINKFSAELPAYTTARSQSQAQAYRAWAWERIGVRVPDRVGEHLQGGERCAEILRGVELDLRPGAPLSERDQVRLATLRFLQSYGSSGTDVERWKARLALTGWADPVRWQLPADAPDFGILALAQKQAAAPDTAISETGAGEALHRLTYATARRMYAQLQPPMGGYRRSRLLDPERAREATGLPVEDWSPGLIERALADGLDEGALEYLEELDAHPSNADFETFALARSADIVGTRYRLPLQVGWGRLVLSDLDPVREAFQAQYGRAALALARGDSTRAELVMRTTLAGAVQLARNAPFEVDAIEALRLALETLDGLERVLAAQGREADVTWLDARNRRGEWVRAGYRSALFSANPAVLFRALPALAQDQGVPYAFRRFAYRQVALFDVCLSRRKDHLSKIRHREWTAAVEAGLAARPSDAQLLEAIRRTVRELLEASAVPPEEICAPATVAQPRVRVAIMSAPPRGGAARSVDQGY
jgi:hypothetical protein